MSYQSDKFQLIKDLIVKIDKYANFVVNFDDNKMHIYSNSIDKENEILHCLRMNNIVYLADNSKRLISIYIKL
jgi:hypothetical protein